MYVNCLKLCYEETPFCGDRSKQSESRSLVRMTRRNPANLKPAGDLLYYREMNRLCLISIASLKNIASSWEQVKLLFEEGPGPSQTSRTKIHAVVQETSQQITDLRHTKSPAIRGTLTLRDKTGRASAPPKISTDHRPRAEGTMVTTTTLDLVREAPHGRTTEEKGSNNAPLATRISYL